MTSYIVSKDGIPLWKGDYPSKQAAIEAYVAELADEGLAYDSAKPDWKDDLEVTEY